jgi:hypothetical protein
MGFVADAVKSAFDLVGDLVEGVINVAVDVVTFQWDKIYDDIMETISKVITDVLNIIASILTPILGKETAIKIAGAIMIAAVLVFAWYAGQGAYVLAEAIGNAVAVELAMSMSTITMTEVNTIILTKLATEVLVTVAISTGVSLASSAAGAAIAQQVPSLGLASSLLPLASMLSFGYTGGFGAISHATQSVAGMIGLGGGAAFLAPMQALYGIYNTVEEYQGYLQMKAGLEESYNSIYQKFKEYNDGLKNEGFAETMQFATGKYYQNFAGQPMYNVYQPSRELYIPMDVAKPFDGSTKPRIDLAQYQFDVDALYIPKQDFITRTLGLDLVRTS